MNRWMIAFCLLLAGCTLHPKYCRPVEEEIPCTWRIPTDPQTECNDPICFWRDLEDDTLNQLIEVALQNNQDIKTAIYRVDAFLAQLQIVNSKLYPQVSAELTGERERESLTNFPTTPGIDQTQNLFTTILKATYFVDLWGKVRSSSQAALAEVYAEVEARRAVVLSVVSSVAISYIRLRQYDQQMLISKETLATRQEALYLAEIRFELGLTSQMQVDQALSEVQDALTRIKQLEISIALEEDLISILLGEAPGPICRGKILSEITQPPTVPVFLPSELLNQRPDILEAENRLVAANARIGVARSLFFPQINLAGFYGSENTALSDLFNASSAIWQYGATILQEIFTGGRLTGGLKKAWAEKNSLVHKYQSTILTGLKEVNDALISHKINLELVEVEKKKVATYQDYLDLSTLRYNEGETDYLTVLDAQRRLFESQLNLAQFRADTFTSLISIYQSLGGNWVNNADASSICAECGE